MPLKSGLRLDRKADIPSSLSLEKRIANKLASWARASKSISSPSLKWLIRSRRLMQNHLRLRNHTLDSNLNVLENAKYITWTFVEMEETLPKLPIITHGH